jgi:predicted ATP-grasp superfamily ATP-dependent carboligase
VKGGNNTCHNLLDTPLSEQPLLLVGPSTRALAWSARRAGFAPHCLDLFGDVDLQRLAASVATLPVEAYPQGLVERAARYPADWPLVYTGGLENHPQVYLVLAEQRPVWGYVHPDPLQGDSVRRPEFLDAVAKRNGFRRPRHQWSCRHSGRRLVKPRAGAGGRGIAIWDGVPIRPHQFLEEWVEGVSLSVACLRRASTQQADVEVLGITRQLIGEPWLHAPTPFTFCGNVGPWPVVAEHHHEVKRIAQALVDSDPYLRGLFGLDFMLTPDGLVLLEVNPRYTASMELLERAIGSAFLAEHAGAFHASLSLSGLRTQHSGLLYGKAIYYAPRDMRIDVELGPEFADIPAVGSQIPRGQPVATLLAEGADEQALMRMLKDAAHQMLNTA